MFHLFNQSLPCNGDTSENIPAPQTVSGNRKSTFRFQLFPFSQFIA